jgi:hypothetical protein
MVESYLNIGLSRKQFKSFLALLIPNYTCNGIQVASPSLVCR